ncbi:uncharacterized protein LOC129954068 [Eupeodes corollae]|uniref:uncharacterized protein LOC129954068 n=1 Tax=Eupeodes corollae TaxID=290404 RepID=UPI00249022BE|nr:uncharacterized protein LOC129954068 [Eupeodes corollae]
MRKAFNKKKTALRVAGIFKVMLMGDQSYKRNSEMLDSIENQLREAEAKHSDIERAHKETLIQIRNFTISGNCDDEYIENLQSKARELEKKVALETVRCEELQLELSAAMKSKLSHHQTMQFSNPPPTSTNASVKWAPAVNEDQNLEVESIMAKIEQDNRVLAELEEPRTSGITLDSNSHFTSMGTTDYKTFSKNATSSALTEINVTTNTNTTNGLSTGNGLLSMNPMNIPSNLSSNIYQTSNTSTYPGTSCADKVLIGPVGINMSSHSPSVYSLKHIPSLSQRGTIQLYNLQSTTMPMMSLHCAHPASSSSYSLGLSGISVTSSYMHPNISSVVDTSAILGNSLSSTVAPTGSASYGITGVIPGLNNTYSPPFLESGAPLLPYSSTIRSSKPKLLDEVDFSVIRYGNRSSPCSPIPALSNWGFDDYIENMNSNLMHSQRGIGLGSTIDIETHGNILNGSSEPQVDMLDIPGKGRCCVFISRFPYDPPE